jgi:D-alanine-D-alanine ligase
LRALLDQRHHALEENGHEVLLIGIHDDPREILDRCAEWHPDLVMNCVEAFRSDDHLDYLFPALLESGGYHYTGSSPLGLLVSRDKAMSKKILAFHGIRCRPSPTTERRKGQRRRTCAYPHRQAARRRCVGRNRAGLRGGGPEQLRERVASSSASSSRPSRRNSSGPRAHASVIGNEETLEILPLTELIFDKEKTEPEERIATQSAKWDEPYRKRKGIKNVFARPVSAAARERIDAICRTAFRALWLRDYARIDLRLTEEGEIWVLEANANPFISRGHEIANAADKAGMPYPKFIQRIVDEATARYGSA